MCTCAQPCVYFHVCAYSCMCIYMPVYILMCIYTHVCAYSCVCIYSFLYILVCMYTHVHTYNHVHLLVPTLFPCTIKSTTCCKLTQCVLPLLHCLGTCGREAQPRWGQSVLVACLQLTHRRHFTPHLGKEVVVVQRRGGGREEMVVERS